MAGRVNICNEREEKRRWGKWGYFGYLLSAFKKIRTKNCCWRNSV
jgi:hypothetical protein